MWYFNYLTQPLLPFILNRYGSSVHAKSDRSLSETERALCMLRPTPPSVT